MKLRLPILRVPAMVTRQAEQDKIVERVVVLAAVQMVDVHTTRSFVPQTAIDAHLVSGDDRLTDTASVAGGVSLGRATVFPLGIAVTRPSFSQRFSRGLWWWHSTTGGCCSRDCVGNGWPSLEPRTHRGAMLWRALIAGPASCRRVLAVTRAVTTLAATDTRWERVERGATVLAGAIHV